MIQVDVIRHIPQGEHILSYSLIKPSFNKVGKSGLCIKILWQFPPDKNWHNFLKSFNANW